MEIANLLNQLGMLFIFLLIGLILKKTKIIKGNEGQVLINLTIYLLLPLNIIDSFQMEFDLNTLVSFALILIISGAIQFFSMFLGQVLYQKRPENQKKVLQYATVCSNAGFMGSPIAQGIYGGLGLTYASIFLIPMRIVMWSVGVAYFTKSTNRREVVIRVLTHPCIIAVFIGLGLMLFQVRLPGFVGAAVTSVGNCATPISMIFIGTILAEVDVRRIFSKTILAFSVIRLLAIPGIVFLVLTILKIDPIVTGVSVLLSGMPAGSTTAILAAKYGGDQIFATKCVVFTTLLSMITIPIWSLLL